MRRCFVALALAMVLPWPAVAAEVVVRPGETLSELAERHGVSVEQLLKANGITDANHVEAGRRLLLPAGAPSRASAGRSGSGGGTASGGSVVVQPGETLSEIAARAGISLTRLMQLNGITKPDSVQAGARLVLGGAASGTPGPSAQTSASRTRAGDGAVVVVRSGETLSQIAEREGVSLSKLMQLNGIAKPEDLQVGTRLVLGSGRGATGSTAAAVAVKPASFPSGATSHEVKPGESLSVIADGYGVPMGRLLALNGIRDPNKVNVGTKLLLRGSVPSAPRTPSPTASPAHTTVAASTSTAKAIAKPAASKPAPSPTVSTSSGAPNRTTLASATAAPVTSTAVSVRPADVVKPSTTANPTSMAKASASPANSAAPTGSPASTVDGNPAPSINRPSAANANSRPTQVATAAASSRAPQANPTPSKPDWRTYGPLQVDWANWQPMGGSLVAPTLNADGRSLYLAINCGARKLNATGQAGQWKTWDDPQTDFENQILSDLCKSRT